MKLKAILCTSLFLASSVANADEISPAKVKLTSDDRAMIAWVDQHQDEILAELKTHVEINTGTANIEGLNRYRDILEAALNSLGFQTEQRESAPLPILNCAGEQMKFANHLIGKIRGGSKNRLLLNGHMDTVFPKTDEFQTLSQLPDGTLAGPGVADMKGGIVIMLNALRALQAQNLLTTSHLTVLFNTDEEIGSLGSRALIEEQAQQHDIALVFEGTAENRVTRSRKGLGQARLKVIGREAHAGSNHADGVSANRELAHKIVEIEKLTNYEMQTTVNVGVMGGGEKRNTIAGCADAYVDMRFPAEELGQELKLDIQQIAQRRYTSNEEHADLPSTESWAILHRPAKQIHPQVDKLIAQAMGYSKLIGEPIVGTRYSGGGTDGSITQAVGLPTMDSLGINGAGAHSSRETASVKSLVARTKLAAVMIARQLRK